MKLQNYPTNVCLCCDVCPDHLSAVKRYVYIDRGGSINICTEKERIVQVFIGERVCLLHDWMMLGEKKKRNSGLETTQVGRCW